MNPPNTKHKNKESKTQIVTITKKMKLDELLQSIKDEGTKGKGYENGYWAMWNKINEYIDEIDNGELRVK